MSKFEVGPSSISTLHFVPDFIKELLDDNDLHPKQSEGKPQKPSNNHRHTPLNIYSTRSNTNPRSINRKSVSDQETMAFVAMRDILKISDSKLAQLYNYNQRQYNTFQAVINNKNINYKHWINCEEVMVLYHFFARISGQTAWMEICDDMGFAHYFKSHDFKALFADIVDTPIRAKDEQLFELRFFMKLLIFFWDNLNETSNNCAYFWVQSLSKTIKFISELAVGINIEIYCALTRCWINATIIKMNPSEKQIYAQCLNGSNQHQWFSIYSPRLAPIGFKYSYIPNMMKRNNVPCIVAVIDGQLDGLAPNHVPVRFQRNMSRCDLNINNTNHIPSANNCKQRMERGVIPKDGWRYRLANGKQIGPVTIQSMFISCVEREIDENSYVYHPQFGTTTLRKLPHIVQFFRSHIQKCKSRMEMEQKSRSCSAATIGRSAELSIFTPSTTSPSCSVAHTNSNQNRNVFISESNINRFK